MVPETTPEAAPYWEGVRSGELRYQRCATCDNVQFPFQSICRRCLGGELRAVPSRGEGTIVTFSTVHRAPSPDFADRVPYTVVIVELVEGFRMVSAMVDTDPDDVEIGMPVRVRFEAVADETTLPFFETAVGPRVER